jgi:hypothetical protein
MQSALVHGDVMKKLIFALVVTVLFFSAVNARQIQSDTPRDMKSMMQMGQMMDNCFMGMKDVDITVADTKDGVALTFTPKDVSQLEALRKNVRTHLDMMRGMMDHSHDH